VSFFRRITQNLGLKTASAVFFCVLGSILFFFWGQNWGQNWGQSRCAYLNSGYQSP